MPVELLGGEAELDDEIAGQILPLNLASFFSPKAQQGSFIVAHDNSGIRAADECSARFYS